MPDPNCAHCNGAQHCYQQAMAQHQKPFEAIRTALLTGVAVGLTDLADAPACDECSRALATIREGLERGAEMLGDQIRTRRPAAPQERPAAAPQGK